MLQTPPLIDPLRDVLLPQSRQIRRMIHANLHALAKLGHERHQQARARRVRRLPRAPQRVREDAELQRGVAPERGAQRVDEVLFGFANVQGREEDAVLGGADFGLQRSVNKLFSVFMARREMWVSYFKGFVKVAGGADDGDLVAAQINARGHAIKFVDERGEETWGMRGTATGAC